MVHSGKGLISVFQGFSASVGKAFWWGDWGLGYRSRGFRHIPDFC